MRRNVKMAKAVAGLSYNELLAKKQQKPEVGQFVYYRGSEMITHTFSLTSTFLKI